ncbi:PLP-dependent transferase [Candidatus Roizmanbacteria bacterium]|nr:PLP-dependent transferase [Candidatus Roizmanbacteria bacterium]
MKGFTTRALHTHYKPNKEDGAIIPPLHLSTTFQFGNKGGFDYSRTVNPTRVILEKTLAELDNNLYGFAYSSGSAALANVVALLGRGEKILFSTDAYGGTYRFIAQVAGNQGVGYEIADLTNHKKTEESLKRGNIKIIWAETPTNPLMKVVDIVGLAKLSKQFGALLVIDNTFSSPFIQQPADLGADMVVYSTTKYVNGHSDAIGGALTTSNKDVYIKLKFLQNAIGAILSPFDSWLTLRGLRTLELRMKRHCDNAEKIANFLSKHKKIKKVFYPGLFTGEQKEIVDRQMKRPGSMMSIEIKEKYDVKKFLSSLVYFPLAESLGGVESLIDHPASMTHASIPKKEREKIGLSDGLLRVSVGIENVEDLIGDLKQALDKT